MACTVAHRRPTGRSRSGCPRAWGSKLHRSYFQGSAWNLPSLSSPCSPPAPPLQWEGPGWLSPASSSLPLAPSQSPLVTPAGLWGLLLVLGARRRGTSRRLGLTVAGGVSHQLHAISCLPSLPWDSKGGWGREEAGLVGSAGDWGGQVGQDWEHLISLFLTCQCENMCILKSTHGKKTKTRKHFGAFG